MARKILLSGSSGYIGSYLARGLEGKGDLYRLDRTNGYDITERDGVAALFDAMRPSVVIHCATYGDIRRCEANMDAAYAVNVTGTETIAELSRGCGAYLIFLSTDYVYDGRRGCYGEEDPPNPINYFGKTKRWAEERISEILGDRALTLRTAGVYGYLAPGKQNMDQWVIANVRNQTKIDAFVNIFSTPTFIGDVSKVIDEALAEQFTGLYHLAGRDRVSRFEFIAALAAHLGAPEGFVTPAEAGDFEQVNRPRDVSLRSTRLEQKFGFAFAGVREGLAKSDFRDNKIDGVQ